MPVKACSEDDIIEAFLDSGVTLDTTMIGKCIETASDLKLTAAEVVEEWDAFCMTEKHPIEPNKKTWGMFEVFKFGQIQYKNMSTTIATPPRVGQKRSTFKEEPKTVDAKYLSPTENESAEDMEIEIVQKQKEQRKPTKEDIEEEELLFSSNVGTTAASYNPNKLSDTLERTTFERVAYSFPYQLIKPANERYMNDVPTTRVINTDVHAVKLRRRIEYELMEENSFEADPTDDKVRLLITDKLEPFHLFLQQSIISTARIGKETTTTGEIELFLESSHANQPVRTKLSTEGVPSYSLISGQVVSFKGTNPTSKLFRAKAIRPPNFLPVFKSKHNENGTSIMTASGPFTSSKTLSYRPLEHFLEQVKERKPDALFLCGPFVDERHALIQTGSIEHGGDDYTAEQWFDVLIDLVMSRLDEVETTVFVLPSLHDLHHPFCVYPQPKFECSHPSLGKKLIMLDDPATVSLNGQHVTVGVSSVDTLLHLAEEEVERCNKVGRIDRAISHILQQGSYYPLYPPKEGHCVDSRSMHLMEMKEFAPNILITPSNFAPFAKVVGSTVCVNPGRVFTGSKGSYASIVVHPSGSAEDTRVDILNL